MRLALLVHITLFFASDATGLDDDYKARLTAQGFADPDYETFYIQRSMYGPTQSRAKWGYE